YAERAVPVQPDDTALTLNTRCYEAAVAAFDVLARELARGTERLEPQASRPASYFGLKDRPRAACTLSLARPAHDVKNLVRGLDFGPVKNPLGLPKFFLGERFAVVSSVEVHVERSGVAPGTVLGSDENGLRVATATFDVTLRGLRTLS